jgi:hypothetical protein
MKRRNFVQSLLATPVIPGVLAAEQAATKETPASQAKERRRSFRHGPTNVPHLPLTAPDLAAEPAPHYFTETQFATLRKLGEILQPPLKGNPGAIEAKAPEFLDFLISASPADRQELYLTGLDRLEIQAVDQCHKSFAALDEAQAATILKPLRVARDWSRDFPSDPLRHFVAQVQEDLRAATMNSREWAAAMEKAGRLFTRGHRTSGYYWAPIDPIANG